MMTILLAFLYFSESEVTIQGKVAFEPMMLYRIQETLSLIRMSGRMNPPPTRAIFLHVS